MKLEYGVRSRTNRLILSAFPAIGMTAGLFLIMDNLVRVDDIQISERNYRPIMESIVPEIDVPVIHHTRGDVRPIETAFIPAREPVVQTNPNQISFEVPVFQAPVISVPTGQIGPVTTGRGFIREEAVAVRQPVPDYPSSALSRGLEGECEVVFAIDPAGRPYDLVANCTDEVFARSSVQAVRKALFAAKVSDGVPVGQKNLVYPIRYELNDD